MAKTPAKTRAPASKKPTSFDVPALFVNETHVMAGPGFIRIGFAESSNTEKRYVASVAMSAGIAVDLAEKLQLLAEQAYKLNVEVLQVEFSDVSDATDDKGSVNDAE